MGGLSYSDAGVDTEKAAQETSALAGILAATLKHRTTTGVSVLEHGYYASALRINDELALGICTDGVGSKIQVAEKLGRLDTIGIDCIAMNVNDLICIGAEPIAMVDYVAIDKLDDGMMAAVARGLAEGARQANISIPGGETAQLPGLVKGLDLVGTAVGLVPMERLNDGRNVTPGDIVIGVESSGVHSNGLTLARRAVFDAGQLGVDSVPEGWTRSVGEELIEPTRIYVREVLELFDDGDIEVKAACHITGDGLLNLNRVAAKVGFELDTLPPVPPVFELIQRLGKVETAEMYTVFNMGIGLCIVVAEEHVDRVRTIVENRGAKTHVIGRAIEGPDKIVRLPQIGLAGSGTTFASA
ncbi:MAG: phosphoribosylformylglycinamidine cyclo-ligase [Planctomycetota bacterium]|jgi:phosphoribosylformylglycinamidine cyclo-ligase